MNAIYGNADASKNNSGKKRQDYGKQDSENNRPELQVLDLWNPVIGDCVAYPIGSHYLGNWRKMTPENIERKRRSAMKPTSKISSRQQDRVVGPVKFIRHLLTAWNLELRDAAWLLGFEEAEESHVENIMSGRIPPTGRDIEDRIAFLFEIRRALSAWLCDEAVENEWLREPHRLLDGRSPMDLMREGSMENLILVREYVDVATGG